MCPTRTLGVFCCINSIRKPLWKYSTHQLCCHIIKNEEFCQSWVGAVSSPTARVGSSTACVVAPRSRFAPPPLLTLCGFRTFTVAPLPATATRWVLAVLFTRSPPPTPPLLAWHAPCHRSHATAMVPPWGVARTKGGRKPKQTARPKSFHGGTNYINSCSLFVELFRVSSSARAYSIVTASLL